MPSILIFDDAAYVEPKQSEKDALINEIQAGDYRLSYSSLAAFSISPRNFIAYKLQERKSSPAMLLGEVVHCKVLEPDKFTDRFKPAPNVNAATVEGKNVWAGIFEEMTGAQLERNKQGNPVLPKLSEMIAAIKEKTGITVLPGAINEAADFRARMLIKNRACRFVIDKITQVEIPVSCEFAGIKFSGRVDGRSKGIIVDIKNMPDATIRKAEYTIKERKMSWQAAIYSKAVSDNVGYYILAVDGNGETSAHKLSERYIELAETQILECIDKFKSLIEESFFDRSVWDMSQDFWLRSENNPFGVNVI